MNAKSRISIAAAVVLVGAAALAAPSHAQIRTDTARGYFTFEASTMKGALLDASGVGDENEVIERRTINEKGVEVVMKGPGRYKTSEVTLKRGVTSDTSWWTWRKKVTDGRIAEARMGVTLSAVDARGVATAQWTLFSAWPSKLVQTSNADGSVVEVLTLTTDAIDRKK